ncbi:MAG: hypothetical protein ACJ763_15755 [Bdellovibrionia bacterium]
MRLFFALLCLISLIVELSFDSTNSFVRISASQSDSPLVVVLDSASSANSANLTVSSSSSDHLVVKSISSDQSPEKSSKRTKATVVYSMGHYSGPASSFIHFVPQSVNRVEHRYVWNYRHIDQFALLRPPITVSRV